MNASSAFAPCPFCGGPSYHAVTLPAHRVIACRRCQIARTDPPPGTVPYDDQDFHGSMPYRSAADLPATWRGNLHAQRDLLRRHLAPGASVLEIGCGQGFLLQLVADAGFKTRGIEPSRTAARAAQAAGLDVIEGYFDRRAPVGGPFDAVIVSHVFEHIENSRAFIDDVTAIAPGGLLLLVQANWRGWVPRKNQHNWHAWAAEHHFWHFTPHGLSRWLGTLGADRVELEYSSLEHGNYWLSRLARFFPRASDQFHLLSRLPRR